MTTMSALQEISSLAYTTMREGLSVARRHSIGKGLSWSVMRALVSARGTDRAPAGTLPAVRTLQERGQAPLPSMGAEQIQQLKDYFVGRKSQVDQIDYGDLQRYFDHWRSQKILRPLGLRGTGAADCPLSNFARSEFLVQVVEQYLGLPRQRITCNAQLDSLICLREGRVIVNNYDDAVEWHRDVDSWRFVKVFVYLTDVAHGDGHHEVFLNSHLHFPLSLVSLNRKTEKRITDAIPSAELMRVYGQAGTCFIENTTCFHRGTPPRKNDRLMLTLEYSDDAFYWHADAKVTFYLG